jgi:hypothetical protein
MAREYFRGHMLTPQNLETLRRQVESFAMIDEIDDEVRGIVMRNWPELAAKIPPEHHEPEPRDNERSGRPRRVTIDDDKGPRH